MIDSKDINAIKNSLKNQKHSIIKMQDDVFNRKIVESLKFDILVYNATAAKKDTLRQADSGFNEVLARIMKKKNIALGIDFEELRKLQQKDKAAALARIIQNIKICRKTGTRMKAINGKDTLNALLSLGASTQQAKEAAA